jgi:hypothetical protein
MSKNGGGSQKKIANAHSLSKHFIYYFDKKTH